jgi:2-phosphosulfolactate phosphatase
MDMFLNPDARCRLRWGRSGAEEAAARGEALVIIDVLSFSTATVAALSSGARVRPCRRGEDAAAVAAELGAEAAVSRKDVPRLGRFSLSPDTMLDADEGTSIVLSSPNGSTCVALAETAPAVFVAGLVNAAATGRAVTRWLAGHDESVTVVPCGERWRHDREDGPLRVALEDHLGAGAVLAHVRAPLSAEAELAAMAFRAAGDDVPRLVRECAGGLELCGIGFPQDPEHAGLVDEYDVVAHVVDGWIVAD